MHRKPGSWKNPHMAIAVLFAATHTSTAQPVLDRTALLDRESP